MTATAKNKDKTILDNSNQLIDAIDQLGRDIAAARDGIGRIIYGQSRVVEETLITLLAGGHLLLIGVPGLGKTLLVETLGTVFGLDDRRVQFTPDLMPADILGSEVLEESERGRRTFRFIKGPVFCQLLMAGECQAPQRPRTRAVGKPHGHQDRPGGEPPGKERKERSDPGACHRCCTFCFPSRPWAGSTPRLRGQSPCPIASASG